MFGQISPPIYFTPQCFTLMRGWPKRLPFYEFREISPTNPSYYTPSPPTVWHSRVDDINPMTESDSHNERKYVDSDTGKVSFRNVKFDD